MDNFKCKECDKTFDNIFSLKIHRGRIHKIRSEQTYIDYMLDGIEPKCKCGCNNRPKFLGINEGFREFINGHNSKINNNWGHNEKALKKSHETQKKMFESGELKVWNDGLTMEDPRVKDNINKVTSNPDRNKKISKALTGKSKSDEHKENLSKAQIKSWDNREKRENQRNNRLNYIRNNNLIPISNLEKEFEELLNNEFNLKADIDYYPQFYIREIKGLFDFKLSGKKILIEVDGDYWHCNPNSKFKEPKYKAQLSNIKKDQKKKEWCDKNGYTLIRFWENDIKNNLNWVKEELEKIITKNYQV